MHALLGVHGSVRQVSHVTHHACHQLSPRAAPVALGSREVSEGIDDLACTIYSFWHRLSLYIASPTSTKKASHPGVRAQCMLQFSFVGQVQCLQQRLTNPLRSLFVAWSLSTSMTLLQYLLQQCFSWMQLLATCRHAFLTRPHMLQHCFQQVSRGAVAPTM
jgi:hypothetical protein